MSESEMERAAALGRRNNWSPAYIKAVSYLEAREFLEEVLPRVAPFLQAAGVDRLLSVVTAAYGGVCTHLIPR